MAVRIPIKIKIDSIEKTPMEVVIIKNQKVKPAVTANALNLGEETSILYRINEGYKTGLCKCSYTN